MNVIKKILLFLLQPSNTEEEPVRTCDGTRKVLNKYWGDDEWTTEVVHQDEYGNKLEDE